MYSVTDYLWMIADGARTSAYAEALRAVGVRVHVFDDEDHTRPDSVFPNNWISTHAGGKVAVFPMYASNRRHERRADVLELLKSDYRVQAIVDYLVRSGRYDRIDGHGHVLSARGEQRVEVTGSRVVL